MIVVTTVAMIAMAARTASAAAVTIAVAKTVVAAMAAVQANPVRGDVVKVNNSNKVVVKTIVASVTVVAARIRRPTK